MRAALSHFALPGALLFLPGPAIAQIVEPIDDLQWLTIENIVAPVINPLGDRNSEGKALVQRARAELLAGRLGEARRLHAQARVVFHGGDWTPEDEFLASLALRPDHVAVDPDNRLLLVIGQHFATAFPDRDQASAIAFRILLRKWRPRAAADVSGDAIELARATMAGPDLLEQPQHLVLNLSGVPDGSWEVVAEVSRAENVIGRSATRIFIARGLERDRERLRRGLARQDLRKGLAASIAYPIDLAEGLDRRDRRVRDIDLRQEFDSALALLKAIEGGEDRQWQARGQTARHYRSGVSQRIETYRLYIPEGWDGVTALPLAVMLHGSLGDERSVFVGGLLEQAARSRGIAIVSPMGDDPDSVWGNRLPAVLADGSIPAPRPVVQGGRVQPVVRLPLVPAEADVRAVLTLVQQEYPIDRNRIYLGGNSVGGEGTLHLGSLWPDQWAAIAPGAGPINPDMLDYDVLSRMPVLMVHGAQDTIMSLSASARIVRRIRAAGGDAALLSPEGGHDAYSHSYGEVLDFFLTHSKAGALEQ